MKVEVDASACTGCAVCTDLVPEVFELSDDNISVVKTPDVPAELADKVREAVDSCPVTCISIS
jgi:ferredoxin